ncbi:hypothetical protein GGH99_000638 [Coemansia sp. RSA 1285]|nr:hypothetical protein GGH99_000638 [Coemansia sp. RSA 1285]
MKHTSNNRGPPVSGRGRDDTATHNSNNSNTHSTAHGADIHKRKEEEEDCCRCCCKHRCGTEHVDDQPTAAEQLADDAAKDAGWNIRWPRIRMMADSPDLQRLHDPASKHQQQQEKEEDEGRQLSSDQGANRGDPQSSPGAWTQIGRFIAEITEVFGNRFSRGGISGSTHFGRDDLNVHDNTEATTALLRAAESADGSKQYDETFGSTSESRVESSVEEEEHEERGHRVGTWKDRAIKFARGYPLLALLCGWLVMVTVDWIVTSAAIPLLMWLLTARPWSPFSESFVLRAALQQPGLLDISSDGGGSGVFGLGQSLKSRLVGGELMLDDLIWRTQVFVAASLVPLTHSHSLMWLCIALLSLGAMRKCSKAGVRAALLCIAYFFAVDLVLWSVLGGASLNYSSSTSLIVQPSYECNAGVCMLAKPTPPLPLQSVPLPPNTGLSHTYLQPSDVRSPFADAVQQAMRMRRALVERRAERLSRLHGWRQHVKQAVQNNHSHIGDNKGSAIAALATFAVYTCVSGWTSKHTGVSAVLAFALLFAIDVFLNGVFRGAGKCAATHTRRVERMVMDTIAAAAAAEVDVRAVVSGSLACGVAMLANTFGFWSCIIVQGVRTVFEGHTIVAAATATATAVSGPLLPIHVLSVTLLLAMRECAYAVHSMRVWYATVVRERRRGPVILTRNQVDSSQITVARYNNDPVVQVSVPPNVSGAAGSSGALMSLLPRNAAYAHRICFLCLGGFCERCLLSMEIWPTADSTAALNGVVGGGEASLPAQKNILPVTAAAVAAGAVSPTTAQQSRRKTKSSSRHNRPPLAVGNVSAGGTSLTSATATAAVPASFSGDSASQDTNANGLPPLSESLKTVADVVEQQLAQSDTDTLANMIRGATIGSIVGQSSNISGQANARRGRAVDIWIASSVAHCPCRMVHGVGPSSFVAKRTSDINGDLNIRARNEADNATPTGTLITLAQYAYELKSLGLVRSVDPVSAVHADDDPAALVLPLIFGRFAVPENPHAVAAANTLMQSSSNGHTPGNVPFLAASDPVPSQRTGTASGNGIMPQMSVPDVSGLGSGPDSISSISGGTRRPSRILAKSTPLSMARIPNAGTFRLCVEAVVPIQGIVRVSVVMTPVLAHLLLTHPRTASTAAVCVPASLVSAIVSRARNNSSSNRTRRNPVSRSAKTAAASSASSGSAAESNGSLAAADIDPFVDYARVQLLRSDIVVRVNGVRWHDFEVDQSGSLNSPLSVCNLAPNHVHSICVAVCGMRSEELVVVVPAKDVSKALHEKYAAKSDDVTNSNNNFSNGGVSGVAKDASLRCVEQLDSIQKQKQVVQQKLRKSKRELPRQLQNLQNELDSVRKAVARHTDSSARFEARQANLAASIEALDAGVNGLRTELQQYADDAYLLGAEENAVMSDGPNTTKREAATGFNVLSSLDDRGAAAEPPLALATESSKSLATLQAAVEHAHGELQETEIRARRAQDKHEDAMQELKADRASWMTQLSQLTQRLAHVDTLIDPIRRDLKEVTRLTNVGANTEARLRRRLLSGGVDAEEDAKETKKKTQAHQRRRNTARSSVSVSSSSDRSNECEDDSAIETLRANRDELAKSLDTLREALKAEESRISSLVGGSLRTVVKK